jgi:NAD(P)H-hydrate epimerase
MKELELKLIDSGTSALELMDDAADQMASAILKFYPNKGIATAYIGKGNNAGDALRILYRLHEAGWAITVRPAYPPEQWGELTKLQWERLGNPHLVHSKSELLKITQQQILEINWSKPGTIVHQHLLIDGLLGIGATGPLRQEIKDLCHEMNSLRMNSGNTRIWAVDLPTGIATDSGEPQPDAIQADHTATIGMVKQGTVKDIATNQVGRIVAIPMIGLGEPESTEEIHEEVIDAASLSHLLAPRPYELFKNRAGHVGIIAGSRGMLGAARLCSEAALKSGAGLVTLFLPQDLYPIIASALPPEIIVRCFTHLNEIDPTPYQAFLIGPGLGQINRPEDIAALHKIIEDFTGPLVLDADGLNLAARQKWHLGGHILATPHPGEMTRLIGRLPEESRIQTARRFTQEHEATLIYKGARSIVTQREHPIYYNSTGGPAMATAGEGDVLAGVCAGICAQGHNLIDAARLGVYLCGRASEIQISSSSRTEWTLSAKDTLNALSQAHLCAVTENF